MKDTNNNPISEAEFMKGETTGVDMPYKQTLEEGMSTLREKYGSFQFSGEVNKQEMENLESFLTTFAEKIQESVVGEVREKIKLPYGYKSKSPFGGEGVEYHLRTYGHLPERLCCRYDQLSDEKTDLYNKCIDDLLAQLKDK